MAVVFGIGIDLQETARFVRALEAHGERFERRVFTELELEQCQSRGDRGQALAARFAAKEACLKALGTGWGGGVGFRQVEIVRGENGRPALRLHGAAGATARAAGVCRRHVSLTHQPGVVAAVVVLETADPAAPEP